METTSLSVIAIIIATISGLVSIITTLINAHKTSKAFKYEKLNSDYKKRLSELLKLYKDVQCLIGIEDNLCKAAKTSKVAARKDYTISELCEPKKVQKRINDLSDMIK